MTDHAHEIKIAAAMVLALPDVPGVVHRRGKEIMEHTEALAAERDALLAYARTCDTWFHVGDVGVLRQMDSERKKVAHLFDPEVAE
jgi:hypothetical protein